MLRTTLSCLLIAVSGLLLAQSPVLVSEDARFAAQVARDTAALGEMVMDNLIYIHSNALVETKADFIESVGSGRIQYLAMAPIGERALARYGRTAVITGLVGVEGKYQGRTFSLKLRYTAVYRKSGGDWKLLRWQSTQVPD